MAVGLNLSEPFRQFEKVYNLDYFVDKSEILKEIVPAIGTEACYICITRPRRFGKTIIAQLLASYFTKKIDASGIFNGLKAASMPFYPQHLYCYNVFYIDFSNIPKKCNSYAMYEDYHQNKLIEAIKKDYPDIPVREEDAV